MPGSINGPTPLSPWQQPFAWARRRPPLGIINASQPLGTIISGSFLTPNAEPASWPRLTLTLLSRDLLGRFALRGSGSAYIPAAAGEHSVEVTCIGGGASNSSSNASSVTVRLMDWLLCPPPDAYDPRLAAMVPSGSDGTTHSAVAPTARIRLAFSVNVTAVPVTSRQQQLAGDSTSRRLSWATAAGASTLIPITGSSSSSSSSNSSIGGAWDTARSSAEAGAANVTTYSQELVMASRRLLNSTGALLRQSAASGGKSSVGPSRRSTHHNNSLNVGITSGGYGQSSPHVISPATPYGDGVGGGGTINRPPSASSSSLRHGLGSTGTPAVAAAAAASQAGAVKQGDDSTDAQMLGADGGLAAIYDSQQVPSTAAHRSSRSRRRRGSAEAATRQAPTPVDAPA